MSTLSAIILGLVQGVTEFLPVSSSGHLVLVRSLLGVDELYGLAFDAVLHLATALAVIVYFRHDLYLLSQTLFRKLGKEPVNKNDETFLYALIIGTIPAAAIGLLAESYINVLFTSPLWVAVFLFLTAIFFIIAEYRLFTQSKFTSLNLKKACGVGLFQVLALLPGVSRSGITIGAGMLLGMSRIDAARFSFLLAVPLITAVGLKKLLDLGSDGGDVVWFPVLLGSFAAFVSAILVIHYFLRFVRSYSLWPFVWYILILSSSIVALHFLA